MADLIVLAIVAALIGAAVGYIVKSKKKGVKCIGCPHGATCNKCVSDGCCGGCPEEKK